MKILLEKTEHGYQISNSENRFGVTYPDLTFAEVIYYLSALLKEDLVKSQKETREKWEIKEFCMEEIE